MFFILLVYIAAITLESLGSYISVIGLAAKTGPILIFLAITLDFSKIMIASVLYKRWKDLHSLLRWILVPVLVFLVTVTSTGTYAYLIQEFGKTTASSEQQQVQLNNLQKEREKLESRKQAIDTQISQLPPESVTQRRRLTDLFSKESTYINDRLIQLDKELPEIQIKAMQDSGNTGTLGSIAKAWGITTEQVSRIIAFFIVLVIDPLAIVLLTVANFLVEQRKKELLLVNQNNTINSKWDNFKNNIFKNKNKIALQNQYALQPYTDSSGKLIKESKYVKNANFIISSSLSATKPKPIIYNKSIPELMKILIDYVAPTPKIIKDKIHLTPKRIIQKVSQFETIIPKLLNKSNDINLSCGDTLQEKNLPKLVTKEIKVLTPALLFSTVTLQKKNPVNLELNNKTIINVESLLNEPIQLENHESNNDILLGQEEMLQDINTDNNESYIDNIHEDLDHEDIYWQYERSDEEFILRRVIPVHPEDVEGFNLKDQLAESQFS